MFIEFIRETIGSFDEKIFSEFKDAIVGDYIVFNQIKKQDVTKDILIEKIADYFQLKAFGIKLLQSMIFEAMLSKYMDCLDDIVSPYIPKEVKPKKGETAVVTRSRQYYDAVIRFKRSKKHDLDQLIEYTRIMICLYMSVINNGYKQIDNFQFAFGALDIRKILDDLKTNKQSHKKFYDTSDVPEYQLIIFLIMFYYLKNIEVED